MGRLKTSLFLRLSLSATFVLAFVSVVSLINPSSVKAATYTVTKTADTLDGTCDADCSFREAIAVANANSGNDEIDFAIPTLDAGYDSTNGYFTVGVGTGQTLSDAAGVYINGYSQAGSSRNTESFGSTINAVIKIYLHFTSAATPFAMTGSSNHLAGVSLDSTSATSAITMTTSSSNWIEGNFIGVTPSGLIGINNLVISLNSGSNNVVIGTNGDVTGDTGERNLFMGSQASANNGRVFVNTATVSNNLKLSGNYFGVDKTGRVCNTGVQPRNLVFVGSGSGHQIGSNLDGVSDSEEANIFACTNTEARGQLRLVGISSSTVYGNFIGTNPQGDALGASVAAEHGITVRDIQDSNILFKQNTIAYNTGAGIEVRSSTPNHTGLTFYQNILFGNTDLAISLNNQATGTPLPNDAGDVDFGSNELMNYPEIRQVDYVGAGKYHLYGVLDGKSSEAPFTIEICKSSENSIGYGGCTTSLKTISIAASGNWDAEVTVGGDNESHLSTFSALATNNLGSTSEFSQNVRPSQGPSGNTVTPASVSASSGGIATQNGVVSIAPAGTFKYDAYFSNNVTLQTGSFRIPGTNYWQISPIYNLWWKSYSNGANILPSELNKPFIISFPYSSSKYAPNLFITNPKLAYSSDGKKWKVLTNVVINKKTKTISYVTKQGGYYMVVGGSR